jgi:hypothetical protein
MAKQFTKEEIESISSILGATAVIGEDVYSWTLKNPNTKQTLVFSIYVNIENEAGETGNIISAQNNQGYFELHNCTHFLLFEPDEVIFLEAGESSLSSLIIGRESSVSMFANIDRRILKTDITALPAPLLLAAMQLSLADSMLH